MENIAEEKDLGIIFDSKLKFDVHISKTVAKANRVLGLIKRNFTFLDPNSLVTLYKTLVRSLLEYGQLIWCPQLRKYIDLIEQV